MNGLLIAWPLAGLVLAAGLVRALRELARRRAAAAGTTAYDIEMWGLPEVVMRVRLRVGPTAVVVDDPESHRRYDLTPTGLTLEQQHGDWSRGGERERTASGRDGRGNRVEVTGAHSDMLALWESLHSRPLPPAPQPPASAPSRDAVFSSLCIAAAGLLGLVVLTLLGGAAQVVGTVVDPGSDEDLCVVEWVSPWSGEELRNGVDCYVDAGAEVSLWALNTPFRGEVWDTDTPAGLSTAGCGGLVLLGLVVIGSSAWSQRRRARRAARETAEAAADRRPASARPDADRPVPPPLAGLAAADTLTPTSARHLVREVADARAARTWTAEEIEELRALRRSFDRLERGPLSWAIRFGATALQMVVAVVLAGLLAWTSVDGLLVDRDPSATAQATVGHVTGSRLVVWPDDVDLTFTTGAGREVQAVAAVADGDALGSTVEVEYSVEKPFRVRVVGDPGPVRGAALSAVGVLVVLGAVVVPALVRRSRRRSALAAADAAEPAYLTYLLDRGPVLPAGVVGAPTTQILLFDERGAPAFLMAVTSEEVTGAADYGTARIRGELREGALVRFALGDVEASGPGELLYFDPQEWVDDLRAELGEETME